MQDQTTTTATINPETPNQQPIATTPGKAEVLNLLSSSGTKEVPKDEIFKTAETANSDASSGVSGSPNIPGNTETKPVINPGINSGTNTGTNANPNLTAGTLVSGENATNFMDVAIPGLLVWLAGVVGYELDKKGLTLDATEKKTIAPFMQAWLNSLNFNFNNPTTNLCVVIGTIYGMKLMTMLPDLKKKQSKVVPLKPTEAVKQVQETINKQQDRETRRKETVSLLKPMGRTNAIVWLTVNKKLSKKDAATWYDKNVK